MMSVTPDAEGIVSPLTLPTCPAIPLLGKAVDHFEVVRSLHRSHSMVTHERGHRTPRTAAHLAYGAITLADRGALRSTGGAPVAVAADAGSAGSRSND